ncbi:MAG: SGNH/GDSL hydrolase family protein [Spirochaetes bacterium]|nr:SGNH/GDSL hydrolase family protein [Spirochaetota bacterium]
MLKLKNLDFKYKIILILIVFIVIWITTTLSQVKKAKIITPLSIELKTKSNNFLEKITFYRLTPGKKIAKIERVDSYSWINGNFYVNSIFVSIPTEDLKDIELVILKIGKQEFRYNKEKLINEWISVKENHYPFPATRLTNRLLLEIPDNLKKSKSLIPIQKIRTIINWRGDFLILLISFLKAFIYFFIISIILFILYRLPKLKKSEIALILTSITITLILCEIMARIWIFNIASEEQFFKYVLYKDIKKEKLKYTPHHYLNYCLTPNYRSGKTYHNSMGYRDKEFSKNKNEGTFRIVALGGSTTYTVGVKDNDKTFTAQLEQILKSKYQYNNVEVINAGVGGYNSWETLINLQFRVLDIEPDLVIIYHATNDVHTRRVDPALYTGDNSAMRKQWREPKIPWYNYLYLYRIIGVKMGMVKGVGLRQFTFAESYYGVDTQLTLDLLEQNKPVYFARNLKNMAAIAKANKIKILFASWAHCPYKNDYASSEFYQTGFQEMNNVVRAVALQENAFFFDFASIMSKDTKYWSDGRHLNEAGALLKAQHFADYLDKNKLIQ